MTTNKNENGGSETDSIMAQEDTEERHFCWDESNEELIETVKEAGKDNGKENGTKSTLPVKEKQQQGNGEQTMQRQQSRAAQW
eukprot:11557679-Ditylum_brightwellii.AAC.1